MLRTPEQDPLVTEAPKDKFSAELQVNLRNIYSHIDAARYPDSDSVSLSTNWREIYDGNYDPVWEIDMRVGFKYKKLDKPGRPEYAKVYQVSSNIICNLGDHPCLIENLGQEVLAKHGIRMDPVNVPSRNYPESDITETVLMDNGHLFEIADFYKRQRYEGYEREGITVSSIERPLVDSAEFEDNLRSFVSFFQTVIRSIYDIYGKDPPEAKLMIRDEERPFPKNKLMIICRYCASHFDNSLGKCPHCGGSRG